MRECVDCGGLLEHEFRFCPWCAAPQRLKLVEFFFAAERIASDRGKALRVSRYLTGDEPDRHVRFSVWNESGEAEAAISLTEPEAGRLARFLLDAGTLPRTPAAGRQPLIAQLRRTLTVLRS